MKDKDYIKILKYFRDVKIYLVSLILLMLFSGGLNILEPIINANLITNITNFQIKSAIVYSLLFLLISLLVIIVRKLTNLVYFNKIKCTVVKNLRKDMMKNILNMKTINFDKHTSGEFAERIKNDPEEISNILSVVQYSLFSMITDLFILCYVTYINYLIGLVYLLCIFIIYFYEQKAFKKYENTNKLKKEAQDRNSTLVDEILRGIRDIKVLNIFFHLK